MQTLNVSVISNYKAPSFNPLDSDNVINAIYFEQIIGTLVRMSPSGHYEGFLAKSWETSEDYRTWKFILKEGLTDGNGAPIDSKSFIAGLNLIIRLVSKHSSMPLIQNLEGYEKIHVNQPITGLQADGKSIVIFKFIKPVTSGLIEYLGLPYLGHYSAENFHKDGTWNEKKKLVSSSSYELLDEKINNPLVLRRRNFPVHKENVNSFDFVEIKLTSFKDLEHQGNSRFLISFADDVIRESDYNEVNLLPTILHAIVISRNNVWLKNNENRTSLRDSFKLNQIRTPFASRSADPISNFYPSQSSKVREYISAKFTSTPKEPLRVTVPDKPSKYSEYMIDLIRKSLEEANIPYTLLQSSNDQKDMMSNYRNLETSDIKIVSVDSGGGIENQLIKFMFCSKLGVSFPDPSERICKLVDDYEGKYGDSIPTENKKEYSEKFDDIVFQDASVIPMMKSGYTWRLSSDLSLKNISPTMGIPYFDLVYRK